MPRTEYVPVIWKRDKVLKSWHCGSKETHLGSSWANIHKVDPKVYPLATRGWVWHYTVMKSEHGYIEKVTEDYDRTLREAKEMAEFYINQAVCMKSLTDVVLVDQDYDANDEKANA